MHVRISVELYLEMEANKDKSAKSTGCLLPVTRIRTIMKSSPDVSNIGQESVFLIAKAAVSSQLRFSLSITYCMHVS